MLGHQVISFIGAGKMATAIASGLLKNGFPADHVKAYDVSKNAGELFQKESGANFIPSLDDVLDGSDIVILAVKPQNAKEVLENAKNLLTGKLLISIAAGLTVSFLSEHSGLERVIRVMPNTPASIGEGMSCFTASEGATDKDVINTRIILDSFGRCIQVPEHMMDAVTGLSGSGPAFVLEFISGLADGGVYAGLPRAMALEMAIQTVLGTAQLCMMSASHPDALRDSVISPAGTTARGMMVLNKAGFRGIAASAVVAAAERSAELGQKK